MRTTRPLLVAAVATGLAAFATVGTAANAESTDDRSQLVIGDASKALHDKAIGSILTGPSVTRDVVRLNASALDRPSFGLAMDGHRVAIDREQVTKNASGSTTWFGTVEGTTDPVVLVRDGDRITGSLRIGAQQYRIQPGPGGTHIISELDEQSMPPEHIGKLPDGGGADHHGHDHKDGAQHAPNAAAANSVIRVQVIGTSEAESANGGSLKSMAELAVAETNQGYANSGIPITLEFAGYSKLTYTETGMAQDLERFAGTSDGYLDDVHSLRNDRTADVNVLLVKDSVACGRGYVNASAKKAFSVVSTSCATGYYSFGHEIGHNQGALHDEVNSPSAGYNHGFQYAAGGWRTVMAYACKSVSCTRINYWSNPRVTYNGVAMGTVETNDNARKLTETADTVAGFR